MDIEEKIKQLPAAPGVYLMKDKADTVIYVGKALSLKKRVGSYFQKHDHSPKIAAMVEQIAGIDYIPTVSEAEALILEAGLIKEYQPKYNTAIRDDKAYPLLKLTINEEYPRLQIARRKKEDKALYFGPYTQAKLLKQALALMRRIFPLRTCRRMPKSVCLNYHLGLCLAPCVAKISRDKYREVVNEVVLFLEGKKAALINKLSQEMKEASKKQNFELAAALRDRITAMTSIVTKIRPYKSTNPLEELKEFLRLPKLPRRIEAFDVSNISGKEAVGSMVCFINQFPAKREYRRFKIKTVAGTNDYRMLEEVIARRYKDCIGLTTNLPAGLPDLIVVDGGKGQVNTVAKKMSELKLGFIPIIGIAKQFEYIYQPGQPHPFILPLDSPSRKFIQRVRDKAHSFAIRYHHNLREKLMFASELDKIEGVGPQVKRSLMREYESVAQIRKSSLKRLLTVKHVHARTAENIRQYFRKYLRE